MIHFSPHPRKKYKTELAIKVNSNEIKPQTSARYLGVFFDKKLDWKTHLQHVESKTAPRIGLLRFLARSTPDPNIKTMTNLYKALIRSVLTYGFPAFLLAEGKIWTRLQIIQSKALRAAMGVPAYTSTDFIHRITNTPRIQEYSMVLLKRAATRAKEQRDNSLTKIYEEIFNRVSSN